MRQLRLGHPALGRASAGLAVVLALNCNGPEPGEAPATVRDSLGVAVVTNFAPSPADLNPQVSDTPLVTIGEVDGPSEYTFQRIDQISFWPSGGFLVLDRGAIRLRRYTDDGRHELSFGRQGSGPGEFRRLAGALVAGDSILVHDGSLQRLSVFDTTGIVRRTVAMDPTGDPLHPLSFYWLAGVVGSDLVLVAKAASADMRPEPTEYWDVSETLAYNPDGTLEDTIAEPAGMDIYATPERAGSVIYGRVSSWAVGGERIYMTDGGEPYIRVYDSAGELERIIRVARPRTPVDRETVEELQRLRTDPETWGSAAGASWAAAEYEPSISGLVLDDEGLIWAEEWASEATVPRSWLIFDLEGQWVGTAESPPHFRATAISGGRMAGIWRDPLTGVEMVHVYAVSY